MATENIPVIKLARKSRRNTITNNLISISRSDLCGVEMHICFNTSLKYVFILNFVF